MAQKRPRNSMDTILTFDNRDNAINTLPRTTQRSTGMRVLTLLQSDWSVEWSTTNVPGMDMALGTRSQHRVRGRRHLRLTALALSSCLTMHCRVVEPALTTGLLYYLFLVGGVVVLANPLRHFEVYLGQWSISGPGRAFRVLPMLDGIGLAMCITSIIRAINACTLGAVTMLYAVYSISDSKLPFTYCRNWDLKAYDPILKNTTSYVFVERRALDPNFDICIEKGDCISALRGSSGRRSSGPQIVRLRRCNETYKGRYPSLYSPPAYNYFYVELYKLPQGNHLLSGFNVPLLICQIFIWVLMWAFMISEHIQHRKLVWNNLYRWIMIVPWIWMACLLTVAIMMVSEPKRLLKQMFKLRKNDIFSSITEAFQAALYIHSIGTGTEIIYGKGLNFYASGHIDPMLNSDNVWHSGVVLLLAALHATAATFCAVGDVTDSDVASVYQTRERVAEQRFRSLCLFDFWLGCLFPLSVWSSAIFGGLSFSYIVVSYTLIKTALHIIFEYRVKLVEYKFVPNDVETFGPWDKNNTMTTPRFLELRFVEQVVVAALICTCLLLSLPYATLGGIALLESVDSMMTGLAIPLMCLMELVALVYLYRSRDFRSDLNIATEENTCSTRISTSIMFLPLIVFVVLIGGIVSISQTELPKLTTCIAVAPLLGAVLAVPLRAVHNAIVFMHPTPRRGV